MDVNKKFLIVSRAIERMAYAPNKRDITFINKVSIMLANVQSQNSELTNYPEIRYNFNRKRYEGNIQIGNKRKWFVGKTDEIVYNKITKYKNEQSK